MTANGHAANGADAPSKMPHKPWRDDEEDANSLRAIVRANFPRSVDDAFPFLRVARTMTRDDLKNDLVAGLTVAVMVIPQGMAYAALASLRPEIGLYSCILPILTYALVGSSRQLAVGPVAMVRSSQQPASHQSKTLSKIQCGTSDSRPRSRSSWASCRRAWDC